MKVSRITAAVAALMALTTACGGLPEPSAEVVLTEMAIALPRDHAFGTLVWDVVNQGDAHHNLTICAGDRGKCVLPPETQRVLRKPEQARDPASLPDQTTALVLGSGWQTRIEVDLEPGRYRLYCGVPNHAAKGMESVIRVR